MQILQFSTHNTAGSHVTPHEKYFKCISFNGMFFFLLKYVKFQQNVLNLNTIFADWNIFAIQYAKYCYIFIQIR